MKSNTTFLIASAMFLPLVFACSDDPIYRTGSSDDVIHFSMSVAKTAKVYSRSDLSKSDYIKADVQKLDNAQFPYLFCGVEEYYYGNPITGGGNSRGTIVADESDKDNNVVAIDEADYTKISVCSFLYKPDNGSKFFDDASTNREQYIGHLDLNTRRDDNDKLVTTPEYDHYWPKDKDGYKMQFFAVYPSPDEYQPSFNSTNDKFDWSYPEDNPTITTTVEPNMFKQLDYLFGEANASSGNDVRLTMDHIMTAVQVELGGDYKLSENLYIVSVSFDNVAIRGSYDAKDKKWTVDDDAKNRVCYADFTDPYDSNLSDNKDYLIKSMSENHLYFFMLPQTLSSKATLTITIYDNGEEKEIKCSKLSEHLGTWAPGTIVRYRVNDTKNDVDFVIWPAPTSQQSGVTFDKSTGTITTDSKTPADLNGDGIADVNDNFVMYFSYKGTPAGDGENYSETIDGEKQTISDLGYMNVYSVKKETNANDVEHPIITREPFTIVEDEVTAQAEADADLYKSGYYKSDLSPKISYSGDIPTGDYNPAGCNYCVKLKIAEQTGTSGGGGDETALKNNAAKYTFKNTSGKSTTERSAAKNFLEYVCLSVYRPDPDSNGNMQRWKDSSGADTQYSSNCYIINHPGYYKIPVVYGPAIQNNVNYKIGAQFGTSDNSALGTAVQYGNHAVDAYDYTGWIQYWTSESGQNCWPGNNGDGSSGYKDTHILWQDVQDEVKVVDYTEKVHNSYYSDEYYINFTVGLDSNGNVNLDKFKPCNAVIYVTNDAGSILWSYHIWVTPISYGDDFTAATNPLNSLKDTWTWLKYPIGYMQKDKTVYAARATRVKLVQATSGKEAVQRIFLVQKKHESQPKSCVYYQWGRKDPFPGGWITEVSDGHLNYNGTYAYGATDKTVYNSNGVAIPGNSISTDCNSQKVTETEANPPYYRQIGETQTAPGTFVYNYTSTYTIGWGIQHPNTFVYGFRFPTDCSYYDLWGATENKTDGNGQWPDTAQHLYPNSSYSSNSRKTIYDPTPIGYKVPAIYLFPAITSDGKNHSSSRSPLINGVNSENEMYNKDKGYANTPFTTSAEFSEHAGFDFYTVRMTPESTPAVAKGTEPKGKVAGDKSSTFTIYAFGQINNSNGRIYGVGSLGRYWSSSRWCNGTGMYTLLNQRMDYFEASCSGGSSTFGAAQANTNNYGFPILPARDPDNAPNL